MHVGKEATKELINLLSMLEQLCVDEAASSLMKRAVDGDDIALNDAKLIVAQCKDPTQIRT